MKATTKAVYAGVAGAALLLAGTSGTLARWSDSATLAATTIQTGNLDLNRDAGWTWRLNGSSVSNPISVKPGDKLVGTTTVLPIIQGTTLVADLLVPQSAWTPGTNAENGLAAWLDEDDVDVKVDSLEPNLDGNTVTITITFPDNLPAGVTNVVGFDLGSVMIRLEQHVDGDYFGRGAP